MTKSFRYLLVAATLAAAPVAGAMAQGNNPTGNYGSNRSMSASPGTADSKSMSGSNTADVNSVPPAHPQGAMNEEKPGATGRTVVPGSTSSMAGAAPGTNNTKTGVTPAH